MKHKGTITLETNRLILRRFNISDAEAMYKNWAGDDEVTKFLTWTSHNSIEKSKSYITSLMNNYQKSDIYDWGIELKEIGQVIGSIGVVRCNEEIGSVHIGYCIGKQWWNKGITSEAFSAVIRYLFKEVYVNRIESRHDPRNENSGKVMKKCGLQYEGTLRKSDINNQGICDAAWYALLSEDYNITE
jgi:[ribosomal protein S5]-alanine N-acetyltransferase